MKLSVVIPTHDRVRTLRNTLAALAEQTVPRREFEIVVVDDGSSAATRGELRALADSFAFTLVEKEQGGLASARNAGAARARGEILLFLDDDVVPAPHALHEHLASHAETADRVAVVGSLPYPPHVRLDCFLWYLERGGHYDLYRDPRKYRRGSPPLPPLNGNSSIRAAVFHEVRGYDESFRQYGSEDLELGHRLVKAGVRFVYNPRAVGYHDHVKDFPRFCQDMERAGESLIGIYRKHPEIRAAKKIDVVQDRLWDLPAEKRPMKVVLALTTAWPAVLGVARFVLRVCGRRLALRYALFPLYRWVAYYHYAVGMRRGLAAGG
jgi:GT2 family glycosyltransferase